MDRRVQTNGGREASARGRRSASMDMAEPIIDGATVGRPTRSGIWRRWRRAAVRTSRSGSPDSLDDSRPPDLRVRGSESAHRRTRPSRGSPASRREPRLPVPHYNRRMPSRAGSLVHARGLTKRFGSFTAVDGVDFDVAPGEAFGFLGPNGAGKTSTMRMIGCASPITTGELRVFGMDPRAHASAIKARLGVVPQDDNLDNEITVRKNLSMYARYFDVPRGGRTPAGRRAARLRAARRSRRRPGRGAVRRHEAPARPSPGRSSTSRR